MTYFKSRHWSQLLSLGLALGLSVAASGCGNAAKNDSKGATKPRVSASGKIECDGKAPAAGTITFSSADTGNNVSGPISNGAFSFKASDGPNTGPNNVVIVGKDKAGGPGLWTWKSKIDISEKGFTGDFTFKAEETTASTGPSNPDD